ncbi:MAG: hypothetical protein OMM_09658 [Candidatus Magnetoglobus multicellularis str. Araruama]|uniref:Uncharacterized protein n=1 Tax=Candidatus Magnetoglobus multicellularis str. Araruama TaxID=890399 RepID=A0A1V1P3I9_9BACT|nr:MAG: hypothetical protein OMM_09658 [Candidatus Magnetoglobus multicellularis str. Araruama]
MEKSDSKWLAKLLYRKKYIGGKYEGTSELIESNSLENKSNIENLREPYFEKFEIKQNLYHIKILGKSLTLNKKSLISTWSGNLI